MKKDFPRIGVFDSGVGGLTVLKECFSLLPEAEYFYLGDNARAPYGNREEGEICAFVREALRAFEGIGVDIAVLACNTATAVCIDCMRREFSFPIVGTEPAIRPAARECGRALVLATVRTAESARLKRLIESSPSCRFTVLPCPDLAGEIERAVGERGGDGRSVHFPPIGGKRYDGVVLGCTHYVFFREQIAAFYGCKTYDGNRGVAETVADRLNLGTADHRKTPLFPKNQNICFEKYLKEMAKKRVHFLGNAKEYNDSIFFSNICFTFF